MKGAQQPFIPNKKLILHFDVDGVLRLPTNRNKDLYVYEQCAGWVWGKIEKNSKQNPNKVTGWKLVSNSLLKQKPEGDAISYKNYLQQYIKPEANQYQNLILNLSKGPASRAKSQIQKTIKNITIPKTLYDALKQGKSQTSTELQKRYIQTGKYEILPAFYKLFLNLKKNKREFAIIVKTDKESSLHLEIINQLNLFFMGEHPLYNGKNGTPIVKMDGTNKCKNFVFDDGHFQVIYWIKNGENSHHQFMASFGTHNFIHEKDNQLLRQSLKSNKKIQVCQNISQIYSYSHSILAQSAFIYQINQSSVYFIDQVDYLTQQIYFSHAGVPNIYSSLGNQIERYQNFFESVDQYELLRDVDYFIRKIEKKEENRVLEIQKIEKGEEKEIAHQDVHIEAEDAEKKGEETRQSDAEYLKRTIIPLLDGAFRQVDLFRPDDPVGFVALYCLKNRERIQ